MIVGESLGTFGTISLAGADYQFVGESPQDEAGRAASGAGDVDGDGLDDLLIGAPGSDEGGSWAGKVYLILGDSLDLPGTFGLAQADYHFIGEAGNSRAGRRVSSAGDVDGDGLDDLLIGSLGNDDLGKAYLFLGGSLGGSTTESLDHSFVGENSGDYAGSAVSSAGDVDSDGLDDLLIAASDYGEVESGFGKTYLILGNGLEQPSPLELSLAHYGFTGEHHNDFAGRSVSSAGDVNGDGRADLLIGAPGNADVGSWAGKTYLILSHL